jgi:aldehyde dehydrogenase (NAD+)
VRILEHHSELAELECRDTGKPIHQAKTDITACARYLEFFGGAADKLHGETIPYAEGFTVFALREPYGVTGHIIPWNYPAQILDERSARPSRPEMLASSSPQRTRVSRSCA